MTWTVTASNPSYNYTGLPSTGRGDLPVYQAAINCQWGVVSACILRIQTDIISKYALETDDTNQLQLNSLIDFKRDANHWFIGKVVSKPVSRNINGINIIEVNCHGKDGILLHTLIPDVNGNETWSLSTDAEDLIQLPLLPSSEYGSFNGDTLWPDPSDADGAKCYIKDASSNTDDLTVQFTLGDTEAILSVINKGIAPRGWIKVEAEWVYYDGYDNADGAYRLRNCKRGELGTLDATHINGSTVTEKVPKQIAPGELFLEWDDPVDVPDLGYARKRRDQEYVVMPALCAYALPIAATGTYRVTCSVYDEDKEWDGGHVVITLGDIVKAILKAPSAYGGAGLGDGDISIHSSIDAVRVNRYDYDPTKKPKYAWDAIHEVIDSLQLTEEIKFWFRHHNNDFRLKVIDTEGQSFQVSWVRDYTREVKIEDCYSGVRIYYNSDQNLNRADQGYSWHQAAIGVGASPNEYRSYTDAEDWVSDGDEDTHDAAGNSGMKYTCDGLSHTKLAGRFWHNPAAPFEFGHWWFGDGVIPPAINLDRAALKVASYKNIDDWQSYKNPEKTYVVRILGCNDYNSTNHTGTWFELGCVMEGKARATKTWCAGEWFHFLERKVNAVKVVFDYMPGWKETDAHWGVIHNFVIEGDTEQYVFVQLTDSIKGNPLYVYAPASFEKMRGSFGASSGPSVAGVGRNIQHPIGAASEGAAISLGIALLKTKLRQYEQRRYRSMQELPAKPELGIQIGVDENNDTVIDYEGIIREYALLIQDESIYVEAAVLDYAANLIE